MSDFETVEQLQQFVDSLIDQQVTFLTQAQETYLQANNEYCQLKWVCSSNPADGNRLITDQLDVSPTDRPGMSWQSVLGGFIWPQAIANCRVDVARRGSDHGWRLWIAFDWGGQTWQKAIGHGILPGIDWYELEE